MGFNILASSLIINNYLFLGIAPTKRYSNTKSKETSATGNPSRRFAWIKVKFFGLTCKGWIGEISMPMNLVWG